MRIYRYASNRGGVQPRLAISVDGGPTVDLLDAFGALEGAVDPEGARWLVSTFALIDAGPPAWTRVADLIRVSRGRTELEVNLSDSAITVLSPLDQLASLRDFLAFEDHVKRGAARRNGEVPDYWYEAPVYYKGNHRALIGPNEECPWPPYTERMDFELELAMIVGRKGRDLTTVIAAEHIFGFTVLNDFSARDIQMREVSAWLGPAKGKDFANALGPCIVTADELGPEPDLEMICRVNGEEWGRGRSSDAHWRWADMIVHVSSSEDIYPADVYGSGTPGGCCGLDLGRELNPGDLVELEIEKIGVLRNRIGSPL